MTVSTTDNIAGPYSGNDVATSFPFTNMKVLQNYDLKLYLTDLNDSNTLLVEGVDYSLALNSDQDVSPGGTITYPLSGSPLATGYQLTGQRILDLLQPMDLTNQGNYNPEVVETSADKSIMIMQQNEEKLSRAIKLPVTDDGTTDVTLPPYEALRVLQWDTAIKKLINLNISGTNITYTDFIATVLTAVDAYNATGVLKSGYVVATKAEAAALTLTPSDEGRKIFVTSDDGGEFTIRYNVTLSTYADDGGTYTGTQFIPTGGDGTIGIVRNDYDKGLYVNWFGILGDGTTDNSTTYSAARASAFANNVALIFPYGKYLIDVEVDAFRVEHIGLAPESGETLFTGAEWPVLEQGPTIVDFVRVGQATDVGDLTDFTTFKNFTIDMTNAPVNARGVFCDYGVLWKTIKQIYIRSAAGTIAQLKTANQKGFDLQISSSATQGLYYLKLDNLTAFYLNEGFTTSGISNDGMRASTIGSITTFQCVKQITFKDASNNNIGFLGVQGFLSGYDPSGAIPDEWGIWMDYKWNTIGNVYLEGFGSSLANPLIFTTESHNWNYVRGLASTPNIMQCIKQDGTREVASGGIGSSLGTVISDNMMESSSIGGSQTQQNLFVNGDFAVWAGGSSGIADNVAFAHSWKSVKDEATATLGILQRTGSSNTLSFNSAVRIEVANPVANNLYGIKQNLLNNFPLSTTTLKTIAGNMEWVTIAVVCRPYSGNAASMRCRISVNQGVTSSSEDYLISYNQETDQAINDQEIFGTDGKWWTLIHHVNLNSGATNFDVRFGYYPTDTTDADIHVDSIVVIQGRHTQYGAKSYIKPPQLLKAPNIVVGTVENGTIVGSVEMFFPDGTSAGHQYLRSLPAT